jgi:hypothetical protein
MKNDQATRPEAVTMNYAAPGGENVPFKLARLADGSHVFVFLEIAQALGYENAEKMTPACEREHIARVQFSNLLRPRKCVTLDGLFTATSASRTDDGTEDATGPAAHFHGWLRAVILPLLESAEWPPAILTQASLQRDWMVSELRRLVAAVIETNYGIAVMRGDYAPVDTAKILAEIDAALQI